MKTVLIAILFFLASDILLAQCNPLPVSVSIQVKNSYQTKISKKVDWIKEGIRLRRYKIDSDSVIQDWYDIAVEIKNTSDSVVRIWMMTCDWENNFIVNNNYMKIRPQRGGCDSNFPYPIKLEPGEVKLYETSLYKSIEFDYSYYKSNKIATVEETKLGLIILEFLGNEVRDSKVFYHKDMNDKSTWKMIWSNPLYLLTKKQYNPNWFQELAKMPCN